MAGRDGQREDEHAGEHADGRGAADDIRPQPWRERKGGAVVCGLLLQGVARAKGGDDAEADGHGRRHREPVCPLPPPDDGQDLLRAGHQP